MVLLPSMGIYIFLFIEEEQIHPWVAQFQKKLENDIWIVTESLSQDASVFSLLGRRFTFLG